ncbi:MAG: hypothetical protein FWE92_06120, partial [Defluviitaleaceae bacterium]|nr:hypothetical protein [Defluviitaleaceae bacterium]
MKKYIAMLIAVLPVAAIAGCSVGEPNIPTQNNASQEVFAPEAVQGESVPQVYELAVSRAVAARMLALARYDTSEIAALPRILTDYSPNRWYDKYINAISHAGYDVRSSAEFRPHDFVTLVQARTFLDAMNPENTVRFEVDENNRDIPVSLALWNDLYLRFVMQGGEL